MEWLRRILHLPEGAAGVADEVDALHGLVIGMSMAGALVVALLLLFYVVRYRRGAGRHQPGRTTPWRVEVAMVLGLGSLFVFWWVLGWNVYRRMSTPPAQALDIQVVAKQWMWKFIYPDGRESIDELVLPVDQAVRLHQTSRDVTHSLYIPAFRLKKDALPHSVTTLWAEPHSTGTYVLLCSAICCCP
ncbi:MAG: cytochrome c oxidase subunit II [Planctomycetota bacterium]